MARLPIATWLPGYRPEWLRHDLIAGATSWAMVVPQAVAYGQIAGLPAQAGLAAAFAGPLGYAMVGTSRQLMVTPTSSTAAISAAIVAPLSGGDTNRYLALSAALAILTGLILAVLGYFRLGFVSQFLSLSVQVGFMFGLGMTIAVGRIPSLLGLPPTEGDFFPSLGHVLTHLDETNPATAVVGLGSLAGLLLMRRRTPRAPAALVVVVLGILATAVFGLAARGVEIVGAIPTGLPLLALPAVGASDLVTMLPAALGLAVIGYAESASVAQGLASRHHDDDLDADRELFAVGAANGLAGLFQSFLVGGGASQSAANDQAGAKSQAASLVVAALALATAVFLTPLFFDLPQAVLAAIVINAVLRFFQVGEMRRIAHLRRDSFALALAAMTVVLVLGVLPSLLLAIVISLALLLSRLSRAAVRVVGRAPDARSYGDLVEHPDYQPVPGLLILRLDAPLFFANIRQARERVLALTSQASPRPRVAILDLEMTADLDIQCADTLAAMRPELAARDVEFWLAGVHVRVREGLRVSGYLTPDDRGLVFPSVETSVDAFERRAACR
jgi:sulfate permease, SulP family